MNGRASVQVVPVTKTDHSGNVVAIQGISVLPEGGAFLLTTIDESGTALTAHLDETALHRFGAQIAAAVDQHQAVKIRTESLQAATAEPLVELVILTAARRCAIGVRDIKGGGREHRIVRARQAAIWAARTATRCTYPMLSRVFGYSDEGSVQDAFRRAAELRGQDVNFRRLSDELIAAVPERDTADQSSPDGGAAA